MDYNLALELKKAGFHQNTDGGGELLWDTSNGLPHPEHMDTMVYAPTLSELIEVCGGRFDVLQQGTKASDTDENAIRTWWYCTSAVDIGEKQDITDGSTPEEAVAKLWLALNKKE